MRELKFYTKEEIRTNYIECFENDIRKLQDYSDNTNLMKTLAIKDIYKFFNSVGFNDSTFKTKCDLFNELRYHINDDGDMSFVRIDWQYFNMVQAKIFKKEPSECVRHMTTWLAIYGHHTEMNECLLLDEAKKYHSFDEGSDPKLTGYIARRLDWELMDAILDHEEIMKECFSTEYNPVAASLATLKGRDIYNIRSTIENNADMIIDEYVKRAENKTVKDFK
jgi:hypothetical protein